MPGRGSIAFYSGPRYRAQLAATRAGAVILAPQAEAATLLPRIVADNPYACFAKAAQLLNPVALPSTGVHTTAQVHAAAGVAPSACIEAGAVVGPGAVVGERAWIGAGCYVGEGATIGADCRLHPHVVVYGGCRLGARVIVHAGAVIGADGFGLANEDGRWVKMPQIGRVLIGDDVEIGANTTIDRGALDDTVIEEGVKLDNQIQIGHNCRIGAHTAMAGCVGVAGSAVIGRHCTFGGAAMILGHLSIVRRRARLGRHADLALDPQAGHLHRHLPVRRERGVAAQCGPAAAPLGARCACGRLEKTRGKRNKRNG